MPAEKSQLALEHMAGSITKDKHISSLCSILSENISGGDCIGYFEDEDRRYFVHPNVPEDLQNGLAPISLGHILQGKAGPPLTRRQRYSLALTLASSFIQLRDTPWISLPWNKYKIMFPLQKDNQALIMLNEVSIAKDFTTEPDALPAISAQGDVNGLDSLGVILIELCFGQTIENHPSRKRLPQGDNESLKGTYDFVAALEWLKEVNDEAGEDYADAVEWCLSKCRVLSSGKEWRKEMLQHVIIPIERCSKYLSR